MYSLIMIDDEIWTLRDMEVLLKNVEGFRLAGAYTNPIEAEQAILQNPPDLVLTDLKMEEMSGQMLMRKIHDHCPGTQIIICSAYRDFDAAREAIKFNVVDYILKPIAEEDFLRAFHTAKTLLDKQHLERSAFAFQRVIYSDTGWTQEKIERIKKEAPCPCRLEAADDACQIVYYDLSESMETWIRSKARAFGFSRELPSGCASDDQKTEALVSFLAGFTYTSHKPLDRVQSYIALHSSEKLTLNHLADEIGFASAYLCDLFRKKCGIQLFSFIKLVRIEMACHLLKTTSLSVREISVRVGYEDNSHFCREFKSAKGVTPTVYRRRALSSNPA